MVDSANYIPGSVLVHHHIEVHVKKLLTCFLTWVFTKCIAGPGQVCIREQITIILTFCDLVEDEVGFTAINLGCVNAGPDVYLAEPEVIRRLDLTPRTRLMS